jgi:hypothetical protein
VYPWGVTILFFKKKDASFFLCIDYKQLNKMSIKKKYHFPRIDDLFDKSRGDNIFSKIDLLSRYHHIRIKVEYVQKIAFQTRCGH